MLTQTSEWKDRFDVAPWMVRIEADNESKLSKVSCVDCFQVRSVSVDRFIEKIGDVSGSVQYEIRSGLSKVLSIE